MNPYILVTITLSFFYTNSIMAYDREEAGGGYPYNNIDGGNGYGYGYGNNNVNDYGDDYEDDYGSEELDEKKKKGIAAAIAIPIAVGVGAGVPALLKKLLGSIRLVNGGNAPGLTMLLPAVIPGIGNLAVGNVRVPLMDLPTPFGLIRFGFNKRSINNEEESGECTNEIISTVWKVALLADMDNLCIPKAFCSVMAKRKLHAKPKNVLEKTVLDYVKLFSSDDEKLLLKRAYQDVISYGSALGAYTRNETKCEEVFDKCSKQILDVSSIINS